MLLNGWGRELKINALERTSYDSWKLYDSSWTISGNREYPDEYKRRLLQSDLCLAYDDAKNPGQFLKAGTSDCCAWTEDYFLFRLGIMTNGQRNSYCGKTLLFSTETYSESRLYCCRNQTSRGAGDCSDPGYPQGPGIEFI